MKTEFSCPICRSAREPANQIWVCGPCHGDLVSRGQLALTSTAEFAAMSPARAAEILAEDPPTPPTESQAACSWCGKSASVARKLLSNGDAHICDGCVAFCADILTAELGEGWR